MLTGCQQTERDALVSGEVNSTPSLEQTDYLRASAEFSLPELKELHKMFAQIYQYREQISTHWDLRRSISFPEHLFINPYIAKEVQMDCWEHYRSGSPSEEEYVEPLPYTKSLMILTDQIVKIDTENFILPVKVLTRKTKEDSGWGDPTTLSFYRIKRKDSKLLISNYQYDDLRDQILDYMYTDYTFQDWEKSYWNPQSQKDDFVQSHVEYVLGSGGDLSAAEYRTLKREQNITPPQTLRASEEYNRNAPVNYALAHAGVATDGSDAYNPNYRSFDVDCANFVSQCLFADGFKMKTKASNSCNLWYYDRRGTTKTSDDTYSQTWSTANGLKRYLWDCGKFTEVITAKDLLDGKGVTIGDPFFIAKPPQPGKPPVYYHAMIITKIEKGKVYYSGHTNNRSNYLINKARAKYWLEEKHTRAFHIVKLN